MTKPVLNRFDAEAMGLSPEQYHEAITDPDSPQGISEDVEQARAHVIHLYTVGESRHADYCPGCAALARIVAHVAQQDEQIENRIRQVDELQVHNDRLHRRIEQDTDRDR